MFLLNIYLQKNNLNAIQGIFFGWIGYPIWEYSSVLHMSSFKIFCVLNQPSTFIFIENKIKKTRNLQRIVTLSLIKMLLVLLKKV